MSHEEILQEVRALLREELAPIYSEIEAITGKPTHTDGPGQETTEPPSIADAYLKQREYDEAHLTGRGLGISDSNEKII